MTEMTKGILLGAGVMVVGFVMAFVLLSAGDGESTQRSAAAVEATVRPTETEAPAPLVRPSEPTAQLLRTNCEAIRGTGYLNDLEREYFLANCIQAPSNRAASNTGTSPITATQSQQIPVAANTASPFRPTPVTIFEPQPTRNLAFATPTPLAPGEYPFEPGEYLDEWNPPQDFCEYVWCVPSFWQGKGYVVQCADGVYHKDGRKPGACLGHGE